MKGEKRASQILPPSSTKAAAAGNSQRSQKGTFSQIHTSTAFFLPSPILRDTFLGVVKNFRLPAKSQFFTPFFANGNNIACKKKPNAQSEPGPGGGPSLFLHFCHFPPGEECQYYVTLASSGKYIRQRRSRP